jgi:hypothetical protein
MVATMNRVDVASETRRHGEVFDLRGSVTPWHVSGKW